MPLFLAASMLAISTMASLAMSTKAIASVPGDMSSLSPTGFMRSNIAFPLAVITVEGIALAAANTPPSAATKSAKGIISTAF